MTFFASYVTVSDLCFCLRKNKRPYMNKSNVKTRKHNPLLPKNWVYHAGYIKCTLISKVMTFTVVREVKQSLESCALTFLFVFWNLIKLCKFIACINADPLMLILGSSMQCISADFWLSLVTMKILLISGFVSAFLWSLFPAVATHEG